MKILLSTYITSGTYREHTSVFTQAFHSAKSDCLTLGTGPKRFFFNKQPNQTLMSLFGDSDEPLCDPDSSDVLKMFVGAKGLAVMNVMARFIHLWSQPISRENFKAKRTGGRTAGREGNGLKVRKSHRTIGHALLVIAVFMLLQTILEIILSEERRWLSRTVDTSIAGYIFVVLLISVVLAAVCWFAGSGVSTACFHRSEFNTNVACVALSLFSVSWGTLLLNAILSVTSQQRLPFGPMGAGLIVLTFGILFVGATFESIRYQLHNDVL